MKSLHEDMAATLLTVMLAITCICEGGESAPSLQTTLIFHGKMQSVSYYLRN